MIDRQADVLGEAAGTLKQTTLPRDRRDIPERKALVCRVRREFDEMQGLSLTGAQACRLFGLDPAICSRVLFDLVDAGYLKFTPKGMFVRRGSS